jgi:hypothetical protein
MQVPSTFDSYLPKTGGCNHLSIKGHVLNLRSPPLHFKLLFVSAGTLPVFDTYTCKKVRGL